MTAPVEPVASVIPADKPVEKPATGTQAPTADQKPADDKPLGPNGEKALQAERAARQALEKQVAELAPLAKLAAALGNGDTAAGKSEIESLAERQQAMEKTIADERDARWRAEIANEKKLSIAQAAELVGASREALVAHADRLLALFPVAPGATGPAPDMSQGARGGGAVDLDARIAEATKAGNVSLAISLQNQKLHAK